MLVWLDRPDFMEGMLPMSQVDITACRPEGLHISDRSVSGKNQVIVCLIYLMRDAEVHSL